MAAAIDLTLGGLAQAAISKYLKQATRYEQGVLADNDPENLHQLRVRLRRLRTALQVFTSCVEIPPAAQAKQVGKVARRLGRLRDLDVVIETLIQHYSPELPNAEQKRLKKLLGNLKRRRPKALKQTSRLLTGKNSDYRMLKKAMRQWLKQPAFGEIAAMPAIDAAPDLLLSLASNLWLHPGWLVGAKVSPGCVEVNTRLKADQVDALITEHSESLHDLRKQVKRFRYQTRIVSDLYGVYLQTELDRLAAMQDTLGQIQDSLVIADLIHESIPKARKQMPVMFSLLSDRRHQAWKQWQAYQKHYLDSSSRVVLRQHLADPQGLIPSPTTIAKTSDSLLLREAPSSSHNRAADKAS